MRQKKEKKINAIISYRSFGKAFIEENKNFPYKIYVSRKNTNRSFAGDLVSLKVKHSTKKNRWEGKVISVLKRKKIFFVGILEINDGFGFVNISEKNVFSDFFISSKNIEGYREGEKVLVKFLDWPKDNKSPFGSIVKSLGEAGSYETEIKSILFENEISSGFSKAAFDELKKIDEKRKEKEERKDFTGVLTFTIDPISAKDFDDAISYRILEGEKKQIGIHIADVGHYIKPGTELDKEAYRRGTSVYLPDRVIPMLPEKISNGLCSLNPNEEKKTFSFFFDLTKEGEIKNGKFEKTLIKSDKRFSYEEIQFVLDSKNNKIPQGISLSEREESLGREMYEAIIEINEFTQAQRKKRKENGAIAFEKKEVEFILSKNKEPKKIKIKENKKANQLVEELMLIANTRAAKYMWGKRKETPFIYRTHDEPNQEKLKVLKNIIAPLGYSIKMKRGNLNKELNRILKESRGKKEENLIDTLVIRSMSKAEYATKNTGHYGLSFAHYAHFTSPIRRYSDILAHRLLLKGMFGGKKEREVDLEKKCSHVTKREIVAIKAEREGNKLMQLKFLENKLGQQKAGFISGVTERGLYVEIVESKCEGFVSTKELGEERFYFIEEKLCLVGERTKRKYSLGENVEVYIKKIDFIRRQAYFSVV